MRLAAILSLFVVASTASSVEGRLFWQTYGSVVPTAEGCSWNANQDFFVPRHCDTCRYGLFSPCKTSCTTSPACKVVHPLYPGYCSIYGPPHYCFRNHLYSHRCGCNTPVPYRGPYRHGWCHHGRAAAGSPVCGSCAGGMCMGGMCVGGGVMGYVREQYHLPNVEPNKFYTLGSISLDGDPMLAALQLVQPAPPLPANPLPQGSSGLLDQTLPLLGIPNPTTGSPYTPPQ